MKKKAPETTSLTQGVLLNLIAWFINNDNARNSFTDKTYTAEMVWYSNSHGELFSVFNCMGMMDRIVTQGWFKGEMKADMDRIIAGEPVPVNPSYGVGIGMKFITMLYRTSPEFEQAVEEFINANFS